MEIHLGTSYERDIDLLIIEEFTVSEKFAKIFLDAVGINGSYEIERAYQSKRNPLYGESDIVFILSVNGIRHAVHIEDKTKAMAMPQQCLRYSKRAEREIIDGEYDTYSVLIVAPEKYLAENSEAAKYGHSVSYERMISYFSDMQDKRSMVKKAIISRAINECKSGYQWVENKGVSNFCNAMNEYSRVNYPSIPKSTIEWWPHWRTNLRETNLVFKSNKGFCDLSFSGITIDELRAKVGSFLSDRMHIVKTGKSVSVRIRVPAINFERDFMDCMKEVDEVLTAVNDLLDLSEKISEFERESK